MRTMKIKLRQEWNDNPQGSVLEPAEHLAKTLIAEGYAVELKGQDVETAIAPPPVENAMDALKPGRRRKKPSRV